MFKRKFKALFLGITLCISYSNLIADVTVPNIIKLDLDAAKALLQQHNLHIGEISEIVTSDSDGTILKQNPRKNSQVPEDTKVRIIIAVAKKTYKKTQVPNVQGLSLEAAKKVIQAANLQVGSIKKIRKSVEEETVLYQTPLVDTPRFENTQVDLVVAEPTPLLVAGVKLNLDKQKVAIGDFIKINAKTLNISDTQSIRYSFTINRKVFYSKKPEFSYQFKEAGKYNVLASVRHGREPWIASETQAIQVVENISIAEKKSAQIEKIIKKPENKESKIAKQEEAAIHEKTKSKTTIATVHKVEKGNNKTETSQTKKIAKSTSTVESQKPEKKKIIAKHNDNVAKQPKKKIAKYNDKAEKKSKAQNNKPKKLVKIDRKSPNDNTKNMAIAPIIPIVVASIPAATLADMDAINQIIEQAGDAIKNRTNIAVVDAEAEEKENKLYQALLAKNNTYQKEDNETSCELATIYYSDSLNETSFEKNKDLLPLVNDNIKTALLSSETEKETANEGQADLSLEQFKQERQSALEQFKEARQTRLEHSKPATFTETKELETALTPVDTTPLNSSRIDKNTVILEKYEQQHIEKIRLSASKQDIENAQTKMHHEVESSPESSKDAGIWTQWLTDFLK